MAAAAPSLPVVASCGIERTTCVGHNRRSGYGGRVVVGAVSKVLTSAP
jgi:hypothetical protein